MPIDLEHPLKPLCAAWLGKLKIAEKHKKEKFTNAADEVLLFLNGGEELSKSLWGDGKGNRGKFRISDDDGEVPPAPNIQISVNKTAEFKQLFAPTMYYQNPVATVTPRKYTPINPGIFGDVTNDPMAQQQYMMVAQQDQQSSTVHMVISDLMTDWLNYLPNEIDLQGESRLVIDEALMKGMGLWWIELDESPGSNVKVPVATFKSVDDLLVDPDVERIHDATWIALRCIHPVSEVIASYPDADPEDLKKAARGDDGMESGGRQGELEYDPLAEDERQRGQTNDLLTYWKVYTKMGFGGRLKNIDKSYRDQFEEFGNNCFIVVCKGVPYPLNMPDKILKDIPKAPPEAEADPQIAMMAKQALQEYQDDLFRRAQWPIPLWKDKCWPFIGMWFHDTPNCLWPTSHMSYGMGELKAINFIISTLMVKLQNSSRSIIGILKSLDEEVKHRIAHGPDGTICELSALEGGDINKLISVFQMPAIPTDIFNILDRLIQQLDMRLGTSEILYGMASTQSRTATDTQVRQSNASNRINDMAKRVESAVTRVFRALALTSRWLLTAEDVAPVIGPVRAQLWGQYVQSADMDIITRELEYRIEAGSTQQPNKDQRVQQMNQALQVWMPAFQQQLNMGNAAPMQWLLYEWGKSIDLDTSSVQIMGPPPPMPGPPPEEQQQGEAAPQAAPPEQAAA